MTSKTSDILNMGKKAKKGKKSKVSILQKLKSLNKKTVFSILAAFCGLVIVIGAIIGVRIIKKRRADRTVRVAFYGLSEDMCTMLKEKIPQEENIILEFDVISENAFDAGLVKDKYDMLFTWRGQITDSLQASAEDIPQRVLETMPTALRNKKCVPILLDHCELAYYTKTLKETGLEIPASFKEYQAFLNAAKSKVFSPYFCNGAEDRIMIDFIGALVMAQGGLKAYNKLIDELRINNSLDAVLDVKLDEKECTLRSILDMLKNWPKEGLTHPSWYNGRGNDLLFFAEDAQLGSFFTLLSEHRKIPYNVIKNYESAMFPVNVSPANYGLIAPALSGMLLSDNSNAKRYIANFFTEETQTEFSDKTNLAPVHSRAQAYDRQADDVRFWAASCAGGAVPDLYLAAYQRRPEELKKLCGEVRSYVR